eukprot:Gb_17094 [translate_table: standard]
MVLYPLPFQQQLALAFVFPRYLCTIHHNCYHKCIHTQMQFFHNLKQPSTPRLQPKQKTIWELDTDINTISYGSIFQTCNDIRSLAQLHAHVIITGLDEDVFIGSKLINSYARCGTANNARMIFDKTPNKNVFLWNAMIKEYARNGLYAESLALYYRMQEEGIQPDNFTFPFVLKACANLSTLQEGIEIHYNIVKTGFETNVYVANALIDMYAKCGSVEDASLVFDRMSTRDVVSWTAMIAGYAQNGYPVEALSLFHKMLFAEVEPNSITMLSVLSACAHLRALPQGKWIHDFINRSGFETDVAVCNSLLSMYVKCGSIETARHLFDKMAERNVISWSTMIAGYGHSGHALEALILFKQMQLAGVKPNSITIVGLIPACAHLGALQQGKCVHEYTIRNGFDSDVSVGNSLVAMYAKCGNLHIARQLFDKMPTRDVVSWSAMIGGYTQNGHAPEALALFNQMQQADVKPNSVTMLSVLSACAQSGALQQGKWIHDYIGRNGFESDVSVWNSLIDMYAKCGSMELACQLFDKMSKRDVVSWNAMIVGYAQNGHAKEALTLFYRMQQAEVTPDSFTMVSVLLACAHLGALQQGQLMHDYIIKSGLESDVFVGTALIDMYAKCGTIDIARQYFDHMLYRDVVSWSAMIAGYGMHGHGEDALALFFQLQQTGTKPDNIIFISVLSACSHAGLVDEGWQLFYYMSRDYSITPRVEHYACMVDLLGRAGKLYEAQHFIRNMPLEPNVDVWGALLGACKIHNNIDLGERVAEYLFDLETKDAGHYILLSNIYAAAGKWDDAAKVRKMMKERGLRKTPGCSLIEVDKKVHAFFVGDKSHPQSEEIYATLESLSGQMEELGYVPNMNFVLHDVEEEMKQHILHSHSEKLAIAFGLLNTRPGTTIRITKNLRVCVDCHSATKFISKIVKRQIIVRDANRFHRFTDGLCSCGDYW